MARPQPYRNVTIVGGSLSGLMHALVFLKHSPSTRVTILERSPTAMLHNQGAGVVAGDEVQEFFSRYVCPPGHEMAVRSKQRLYLDKAGGVVDGSIDDREQRMTSWDVLYRLLRWRVDGMDASDYLRDSGPVEEEGGRGASGPLAAYEYGCTVSSLEDTPSGVLVHWTDRNGAARSQQADLVIAADGASSAVRGALLPAVERRYVGYVAFRGTVPEGELSRAAADAFSEKFAFFHTAGIQILAYLIPGENGGLEPGRRLMNWVWYCNYGEGSAELQALMTDVHGRRHAITLPVDGMQESVWSRQKKYAEAVLPPQFAEVVSKTTHPFVQAITDVISDDNALMGGKVLLVGDALAGFRPHTAASTGQAAFDALALVELVTGKVERGKYNEKVLQFAKEVQEHGVMLGERSQFGRHPLAG
ncbi:hypothetical protein MBLNU459_g4569t1 [Dothideomycetes sp. NU459]